MVEFGFGVTYRSSCCVMLWHMSALHMGAHWWHTVALHMGALHMVSGKLVICQKLEAGLALEPYTWLTDAVRARLQEVAGPRASFFAQGCSAELHVVRKFCL